MEPAAQHQGGVDEWDGKRRSRVCGQCLKRTWGKFYGGTVSCTACYERQYRPQFPRKLTDEQKQRHAARDHQRYVERQDVRDCVKKRKKEWVAKHQERAKAIQNKAYKKGQETLADWYVRAKHNLPKDAPPELIDLGRTLLTRVRELKEFRDGRQTSK